MTSYLIYWGVCLVLLTGLATYWIWRIERRHRMRMAALDLAEAADRARAEANRLSDEQHREELRAVQAEYLRVLEQQRELDLALESRGQTPSWSADRDNPR